MPKISDEEFEKIIEETTISIEQLGNVHNQDLLETITIRLQDIGKRVLQGYNRFPTTFECEDDDATVVVKDVSFSWRRQAVLIFEKLTELYLMNDNQESALYYLVLARIDFVKSPKGFSPSETFKLVKLSLQLLSDVEEQGLKEMAEQTTETFKVFSSFLKNPIPSQ